MTIGEVEEKEDGDEEESSEGDVADSLQRLRDKLGEHLAAKKEEDDDDDDQEAVVEGDLVVEEGTPEEETEAKPESSSEKEEGAVGVSSVVSALIAGRRLRRFQRRDSLWPIGGRFASRRVSEVEDELVRIHKIHGSGISWYQTQLHLLLSSE